MLRGAFRVLLRSYVLFGAGFLGGCAYAGFTLGVFR